MKSLKWILLISALAALGASACSGAEDQTWIEGEDVAGELAPAEGEVFLAEADAEADATLGTAHQALGNNCKNVNISVENLYELDGQPVPILVRYVKYFNADKGDNGEWVTELLPNEQVNYQGEDSWVQNLEGAEADEITAWRVYFSYSTGNEWSGTYYMYINTPNRICQDGMSVQLTVD